MAVRCNIEASLRRVAETGQRDAIALQRYDTEDPGRHGVRDERYWSWINAAAGFVLRRRLRCHEPVQAAVDLGAHGLAVGRRVIERAQQYAGQ